MEGEWQMTRFTAIATIITALFVSSCSKTYCKHQMLPQTYTRAHMSIDLDVQPSSSFWPDRTGWYLRNAGPGVALVSDVTVCVDGVPHTVDDPEHLALAVVGLKLNDVIRSETPRFGYPMAPGDIIPLFAFDMQRDDVDYERFHDRLDDVIRRSRLSWHVSYHSAGDGVRDFVTFGDCRPLAVKHLEKQ